MITATTSYILIPLVASDEEKETITLDLKDELYATYAVEPELYLDAEGIKVLISEEDTETFDDEGFELEELAQSLLEIASDLLINLRMV